MAERVDVCIVGSGFGGSISAYRLAELYRAAGQSPSVMVLERGPRHQHTDFRQSMDIEHLSRIYGLSRDRARRSSSATASAAARTSTWPRRCARRARRSSAATAAPTTAPTGACGRPRSAARRSTPTTRAPSRRCACSGRPGSRSRSRAGCGRRRSTSAGHTLRPRAARDRPQPLHPGEVVPHRLHLRREELRHHELPRLGRADGRAGAPELAGGAGHARARRARTATS